MTSIERYAQIRQTEAFIARAPKVIALQESIRTRTTTGGYEYIDGDVREPQTFTLIQNTPSLSARIRSTDGWDDHFDFVLLGTYDADIDVGDYWVEAGKMYRVVWLLRHNGYETRALVVTNAS